MRPGHLLQSGAADYAFNMAMDEAMAMPRLGKLVLRFYGWKEKAASFGYFQKYADVEQLTLLRPLVRRPTGGGIVPHDADWTYGLAFPTQDKWYSLKAIESYHRVHDWIREALARVGVTSELAPAAKQAAPGQCFAGHEKSDLLWHGKKIAGAAQRRTRDGLLIQGSVQSPPWNLAREDWEKAMVETARLHEGIECVPSNPDSELLDHALALARDKYSQAGYNKKR
jgi:lipoate-protein ligase A